MLNISIVIPVYNEDESLTELTQWIERVMNENHFTYEVIFVDDGSSDNSWNVIQNLSQKNPNIRAVRFRRNYGKSAALNEGFRASQGEVVITMDADMQDSPDEIPALRKMIVEEKFDLVSGWKRKRHDPVSKTVPSKLFNSVTSMLSGIRLHDFNCGLKAYKSDVIKSIEVYGEMHRYIPVIAKSAGFKKIGEKVVEHRARKFGHTKYGMKRFVNGFLDLMSVMFVTRFGKSPMQFFGLLGSLVFLIGFIILIYLSVWKFVYNHGGMTSRPIFYFGLLTVIIGSQLFLTGFIADLVSRNSTERNQYLVREKIGIKD